MLSQYFFLGYGKYIIFLPFTFNTRNNRRLYNTAFDVGFLSFCVLLIVFGLYFWFSGKE